MRSKNAAVLGIRFWGVLESGDLCSLFYAGTWPKNPIRATCQRMTHDAPDENCFCGINLYHIKYPPRDEIRADIRRRLFNSYIAFGVAFAWGKIFEIRYRENQMGYRAEFAYPYAIFLVPQSVPQSDDEKREKVLKMSEKISRAYGILCLPLMRPHRELLNEPRSFFTKACKRLISIAESQVGLPRDPGII